MTRDEIQAMFKALLEEALGKMGAGDLARQLQGGAVAPVQKAEEVSADGMSGEDKSLFCARLIRAYAAGKGDVERAAKYARAQWADEVVAKSLLAGDSTAGGFLIEEQFASGIIELLRPMSVVRRMNPTMVPMGSGTLQMPKQTGGATASYLGEAQNLTATQPTFGMVPLSWKKLGALVPVSNDLLRFSTRGVDMIVRDDLVSAMAQKGDWAFIRGTGTAYTPKGLENWVLSTQKHNMTATPDLDKVTTDLLTLVLDLLNANCRMLRPGWLFAPRTQVYLMKLRDSLGNYAFREEMLGGKLFGMPWASTTQIPITLSTNQSKVYLADFADVVIGEAPSLIIEVSNEATYHDGSQLVSAFSTDQTIVKAIQHHDLVVRHEESLSMLEAVTWGV